MLPSVSKAWSLSTSSLCRRRHSSSCRQHRTPPLTFVGKDPRDLALLIFFVLVNKGARYAFFLTSLRDLQIPASNGRFWRLYVLDGHGADRASLREVTTPLHQPHLASRYATTSHTYSVFLRQFPSIYSLPLFRSAVPRRITVAGEHASPAR